MFRHLWTVSGTAVCADASWIPMALSVTPSLIYPEHLWINMFYHRCNIGSHLPRPIRATGVSCIGSTRQWITPFKASFAVHTTTVTANASWTYQLAICSSCAWLELLYRLTNTINTCDQIIPTFEYFALPRKNNWFFLHTTSPQLPYLVSLLSGQNIPYFHQSALVRQRQKRFSYRWQLQANLVIPRWKNET